MIKVSTVAHLFLFLPFLSLGQPSKTLPLHQDLAAKEAYSLVLNLQFKEAQQANGRLTQVAHQCYVQSLSDVIWLSLHGDQSAYDSLISNETIYLDQLSDLSADDPYKLFYSAEVKVQWAMVKIMFGEEIKAGWSLKSAYSEIERNIERFPDFDNNYKTCGELQTLFSAMPEKYYWLLSLFGIDHNASKGWDMLESIQSDNDYHLETLLIKIIISSNLLSDKEKVFNTLDMLSERYKNVTSARYIRAITLSKYAQSENAIPIFQSIIDSDRNKEHSHFAYYKLGNIYLQKQAYDSSIRHFKTFIAMKPNLNLTKDTYLKMGMAYLLQNNKQQATLLWNKALANGETKTAEDKNAQSILDQGEYPHSALIKVRYSTDGGYFDLAQKELNQYNLNSFSKPKNKAEWIYRQARLHHKTGQVEQSIPLYKKTIALSENQAWYFAPSSCLFLGDYYKSINNHELARRYYKKVLTYKHHPYKIGLDNRAKAGLQMLDD